MFWTKGKKFKIKFVRLKQIKLTFRSGENSFFLLLGGLTKNVGSQNINTSNIPLI